MYCKISEILFEKKWWENKMEGGKAIIEPLGGVEIFHGSVENP
jgi:hypothetical protein